MPVKILVGAQWGDEGKGKIIDYLTDKVQVVVRFQGGNNAGHTIYHKGKKIVLRLLPSGILEKNIRCLLSAGMVVDLRGLREEINGVIQNGIEVSPKNLGIDYKTSLVLPWHPEIDTAKEDGLGDKKIGTTKRGIGPAYEDRVSRVGLRFADLYSKDFEENFKYLYESKNFYLQKIYNISLSEPLDKLVAEFKDLATWVKPYLTSVSEEVDNFHKEGKQVLFEGAQATCLDILHGTYPYVTSSNTLAQYALVSAGVNAKYVDEVIGVAKAYCTRVGEGPFPTEESEEVQKVLRAQGNEFGSVTGRPRRCGWFDAVWVREAIRLNGIDKIFITKLDVLSEFETIKVATSYEMGGKSFNKVPDYGFENLTAVYEELPGWCSSLENVKTFNELPENSKNLLNFISKNIGVPLYGFSIGPNREQTFIV